jgi:hypothetical protein
MMAVTKPVIRQGRRRLDVIASSSETQQSL